MNCFSFYLFQSMIVQTESSRNLIFKKLQNMYIFCFLICLETRIYLEGHNKKKIKSICLFKVSLESSILKVIRPICFNISAFLRQLMSTRLFHAFCHLDLRMFILFSGLHSIIIKGILFLIFCFSSLASLPSIALERVSPSTIVIS